MKVLVADDSVAVTERVAELLKEVEGIELAGRAGNIGETSQMMARLRPDIVILDLQMPDGNAMAILEAIKTDFPKSVVIVLTNNEEVPVREKCLQTGADFFLDKSNEFERLPQLVNEIASGARLHLRSFRSSPRAPRGKMAS